MKCATYYPLDDVSGNDNPTYKEQKKQMTDFAKAKGWDIVKEYREQSKREPFGKYESLKKDLYTRQFDFVLVYSVRAFGRHPLSAIELLISVFLPAGIGFYILDMGYDSSVHSYNDNDIYLKELKKKYICEYRLEGLKKHRLNRNYNQYGYLFEESESGKQLVVDESVSEYVKSIFVKFANGSTRAEITKYLNDNKVATPTQHFVDLGLTKIKVKSKRWSLNMVSQILNKQIYSGIYHQNFMDESIAMDAPVFIDVEILKKVQQILKQEKDNPYRCSGNNGSTPLTGLLFDKKTGCRINSYDRSKTNDFCLRAVIGQKTTSYIYSEGKIYYKDAVQETQRVFLQEYDLAKKIKKYLTSAKGKLEVDTYMKTYNNARIELIKKVIDLNHLDTNRRIKGEPDAENYSANILNLDKQINDIEENMKKLKVALSDKNPWIVLFSRTTFKEDIKSMNYKKYAARLECIDFKTIELIPKNNEWKEMIPMEWRCDTTWQEKAEKTQSI